MHCFERQGGYLNDANGGVCREFSSNDVEAARAARVKHMAPR